MTSHNDKSHDLTYHDSLQIVTYHEKSIDLHVLGFQLVENINKILLFLTKIVKKKVKFFKSFIKNVNDSIFVQIPIEFDLFKLLLDKKIT